MAISISMMVLSGAGWKKIVTVIIIYGVMGGGGYIAKKHFSNGEDDRSETWDARISRYMEDPLTQEIDKNNRQSQYSYFAQAHGGISGVFFGNSRETSRLPLAFSDFIYAIIVEELGLGGGIFVLLVYLWLLGRGGVLASRCEHVYPALLVIGMSIFITLQALFHMAIVTGVAPVSGQPLPLISKGGTSIFITSVALGIMLSVSRHALQKDIKQKMTEDISSLPESVLAHNPNQL
jgi:cell division protein FtsW